MLVTAWIRPDATVKVADRPYGTHGSRITTVSVENLTLHVGGPDNSDAAVLAAAGSLIDALTQLREAARDRIRLAARDEQLREHAHEATAEQMARGGFYPGYGDLPDAGPLALGPLALTPDEGDHYVRPGAA